jgi:hypothetical protein
MTSTAEAPDLRFPIGKRTKPAAFTPEWRAKAIATITETPANLRRAVAGLTEAQIDTPYRPGGWTVRQTIHHVADSHMNAVIRVRLALTEVNPPIKPYDESAWAELSDAKSMPIDGSLAIVEAVHARWVHLLKSMKPEQFSRTMFHPEHGELTIDGLLSIYEWHGPHHTAHITELRKRSGW